MGILTPFFNLFKPAKNDPQAIGKLDENFDIIDTEMHKPPLTVNEIEPNPETRDIHIETVPLADNLSSDEAQLNTGVFLVRASGGGASIADGDASVSSIKGNMIHTGYVPEVLNMTVSAVPRVAPAAITAVLDAETFEAYVETAGTYTLTYDGEAWDNDPSDYGVTVSNTPVDGDEIVIVWDGEAEPVMTVNAVPRVAPAAITATIDRDTFVAYVTQSGTVTLSYTTAWSANPETYGITVTNTPVSGDQITVVYVKEDRGTITPANPTSFNSTGWNLYNNTDGYAMVVKYSDDYGFKVGGSYSLLSFATTVTGTQTAITVEAGYFVVPSDGYVFVTGGDATTYIYPTWSDWTESYEGDFETYSVDTISLTTAMANFPYGLLAIGNTRDEINFNTQKAYSRVLRMAYSAENLANVIASGYPYDADTNYIYVVRATAVDYDIDIDPAYTVSDHGIEFYTSTSTTAPYTEILYGENLKDLLRHDLPAAIDDIKAEIGTVPTGYTLQGQITSNNQAIANVDNKLKRTQLCYNTTLLTNHEYGLTDSVENYDYIEITFGKSGYGSFMSRIIPNSFLNVGSIDTISLSAYNNSSYNAYIECGFPTNNKFRMPTIVQNGWTITPLSIYGIGKRT
jgi:hypothetical protein